MHKGAPVDLPLTVDLHIESFSGGSIISKDSGTKNIVFDQYRDGRWYATQRPGVNQFEDASDTVSDERARGCYYWDAVAAKYFVNDNKVYKGSYAVGVTEAAVTVTDIDGDGSDATCTAAAHGYKPGDKVVIAGATDTDFNGEQTILTVADVNTFTYSTTSSTTNDSGTSTRALGGGGIERVFIHEIGEYLVIIDQEDNSGWYIDAAASTTLVAITDTDFPPLQVVALQLARGGAVLNGKLYLMDTQGSIWESDIEDPTSWDALSVREAEVSQDGGVVLTKHHEHIVAIGNRSLEFFYDAANPTGSTLSVRTDIQFDVGAIKSDTYMHVGDRMYFVGQDTSGAVGLWALDKFQLSKVSGEDIDTFLTSAVTTDELGILGSGFVSGGRDFCLLTPFNTITDAVPIMTLVYVSTRGWFGEWDLELPGIDHCPLVDWMPSATTRAGEGMLVNGDLITMMDDFNPVDIVEGSSVYESGVFEQGVFSATGGSGTSISFEIITGDYDGGTPRLKKQGDLWVMHRRLSVDENLSISVKDDEDADFGTGREVSVSDKDARLNRWGCFRSRNYKVNGQLSEQIRLETLQSTIR